jgi:hypothetical protein
LPKVINYDHDLTSCNCRTSLLQQITLTTMSQFCPHICDFAVFFLLLCCVLIAHISEIMLTNNIPLDDGCIRSYQYVDVIFRET